MKRFLGLIGCFMGFLVLNAYKISFVDRPFQQHLFPWDFLFLYVFICIDLALLLLTFCFRSRVLFFIFYTLQSLFLFVHLAYFVYFSRPFYSRQFVMLFREGFGLLRNWAVPMHAKYWMMGIDLVPFILLLVYYRQVRALLLKHMKIIILVCVVAFSGLNLFLPAIFVSVKQYMNTIRSLGMGEGSLVRRHGILGLDLLDTLAGFDERSAIQRISYGPPVTYAQDRQASPKNIICIQVESLDSRIVDQQHHGAYVTPFLHQLTEETVYYPYMHYYMKAGSTSDAEFTVLNGVLPLDDFVALSLTGYDFPNSIAKGLGQAGYHVKAFHNNRADFFNRASSFAKMGFQDFFDIEKMNLPEQGWGAADGDVSMYMQHMLRREHEPFFYFLITMSSHTPFTNVARYYKNFAYDDIPFKPVRDYYVSMSYVDNVLRDFVNFVRDHLKDTYIFIYGDHAAYTITENDFFHTSRSVPLFIVTPDHQKYHENERAAVALDLVPTMFFAAGIDCAFRSYGVNLLKFPIAQDRILIDGPEGADRRQIFQNARNANAYLRRPEVFVLQAGDPMRGKLTNSFESFSSAYQVGYRLIALDISLTKDQRLVCLKDWNNSFQNLFQASPRVYSLDEFEKLGMNRGLTQIAGRHLETMIKGHAGAYIVANFNFDQNKGLTLLSKENNSRLLKERVVPQVSSFEEYDYAKKLGFKKVILALRGSLYADEEVLDFVSKREVFAVVMPVDMALGGRALKLKRAGMFVYVDSVDDPLQIQALKDKGVDGFYTHTLGP